jgi:hypothetical protein
MSTSQEERAGWRSNHVKGGMSWCITCYHNWPCPVIRLCDDLAAAEATITSQWQMCAGMSHEMLIARNWAIECDKRTAQVEAELMEAEATIAERDAEIARERGLRKSTWNHLTAGCTCPVDHLCCEPHGTAGNVPDLWQICASHAHDKEAALSAAEPKIVEWPCMDCGSPMHASHNHGASTATWTDEERERGLAAWGPDMEGPRDASTAGEDQ